MAIVLLFILSATLAHYFWDYNPTTDLDYSLKLKPPNLTTSEEITSIHLFGTDKLGRDIFRRTIHGGWNSLRVGIVAVGISLLVGGLLGLIAGFYEMMPISSIERIAIFAGIGLLLGAIPAWVSAQAWMALLFAALGAVAGRYIDLLQGTDRPKGQTAPARLVVFAAAGILFGGLPALLTSPYTAVVTAILGLMIGTFLALPITGGLISNSIMRLMDIVLSFPSYLLAIAIVAFLGPGLEKGMIAIGVVGIPVYARIVRSSVLSVVQKEYILAAQSIGEGNVRIIFRYIVPNILSPVIVQTTMGLASAILSAAALGFLGLGAIPPEPEWGAMLGDSYRFLTSGAWWAVLFPGLAIMLSVLGFNLLGDGLRDALDPKLKI
ncbi:MAG: ABC transporter permease [Chloroflexi bacterium]|nr:MAG: ABC transporter permease [Chloroflexota bacterium]